MAEVTRVIVTHDGRRTQVKSTRHDQHFTVRNSSLPLVILLQAFYFDLWQFGH